MRPGATRGRGPALLARCVRALPLLAALVAALFFARRAWFGLTAIGFNDETMHLLGGWALDSGERLYRNFDDVHGPGIFMLMQAYGALFGWAHANGARLVIAGLAVLAGLAVGTSPGLQGGRRWCAVALYFGLLATVWLTQGLYLVSYYPVSGAFAVMVLAWFVVPACARARIPRPAAAAAGVAGALLAFTSFQQAPTALLFSAGGCLSAWRGGQPRAVAAHLAGVAASGVLLLVWLLRWGDLRGYLALHVYFGLVIYPQFGPVTLRSFLASLVPSLDPGWVVQGAGIVFGGLGCLASLGVSLRAGPGRGAAVAATLATLAGLVLLDVRGLPLFQNGPLVMGGFGWFTLAACALPPPPRRQARSGMTPLWAATACLAVIAVTDAAFRHATYSPTGLTRAQFLSQPPSLLARRQGGPMFDAVRRVTHPGERMLALVYSPASYFDAGRLPVDQFYAYLPMDAAYAAHPVLGQTRDLCRTLEASPPPAILFDNWVVWDLYAPIDYMPCVIEALSRRYTYVAEPGDDGQKLFVRNDRM